MTTDADLQSLMPGNIYAADSSAMLTQYKDAFLVPLWQVVKKDPQCKFLSLKFDETDLKEEQGEIETFNRSTQVHEVKFWGDEYIPGIKMDKETLTVQYEAMLQIPGYLMTGNGTKPNDVELLASLWGKGGMRTDFCQEMSPAHVEQALNRLPAAPARREA